MLTPMCYAPGWINRISSQSREIRRMPRLTAMLLLLGLTMTVTACVIEEPGPGPEHEHWCFWHPGRCR